VKKAIIENLFPTPIYMSNINRTFTKQELQFVDNQKTNVVKIKEIYTLKTTTY